ncbi:MAG: hypothetical protein IJV72_00525 [Clostridia bacterium]|nr:hypothetical protein [Clostridia bacterium]
MGKIKTAVLFALVILLLSGCSREREIALDFGRGAFECELSWERGGEHIRAVLDVGVLREDRSRDITLRFEEPRALRGIRVIREDGETRAELDGITVDIGKFAAWLDVERIFDTEGEISYLSSETLDGESVDRLLCRRADGSESEIYLSQRSETPIRVIYRADSLDIDARIIYFTEKTET